MPVIKEHVEIKVNKSATCDMCGKTADLNSNRTWAGDKNCVCENCRNLINKISRKHIINFVLKNESLLREIAKPNDALAENPYMYKYYTPLIGEYGETEFGGEFVDKFDFSK